MFNSLISSGLYNAFSGLFNTNKEDNIIIDPMSCLIKLSILSFYSDGTKINVSNNKISFDEPYIFQGLLRYFKGDGREDLHNLNNPINKCREWYWNKDDENIVFLFKTAIDGLKKLQLTYPNNSTIYIVFDHYINCLKTGAKKPQQSNKNNISDSMSLSFRSNDSEEDKEKAENEIHKFLKSLWSPNEINLVISRVEM